MDVVRQPAGRPRRGRRPVLAVALSAACAAVALGCAPQPQSAPAPESQASVVPSTAASTPTPVTSAVPSSAAAPSAAASVAAPSTASSATDPAAASPTATSTAAAVLLAANAAVGLPGGGRTILGTGTNRKMYVALYGHPSGPALGLLGEQGTAATIRRAKAYAAQYDPYTKKRVVPALEIIATIASASAGSDGDYSAETPVATLRPLVKAAKAAGVYVVLDLQPGRTDFLTQAKRYASLLAEPHVGLALDPEWRLKPKQKHLRQIGSVSAAEINRVSQWLADYTAARQLPQKMLLLHQFRLSMIRDRHTLNTAHPELAFVVQMDGQGSQPAKQDTWRALRVGAPPRVWFGWKNFIDEDTPMLTPKQTMRRVKPRPVWVSYQ